MKSSKKSAKDVPQSEMSFTLYLAGIPPGFNTELILCKYYCKFGPVKSVKLGYNGDPSASAVTFHEHEAAKAAYNSTELLHNISTISKTFVASKPVASAKSKCVLCNKEFGNKWGLLEHSKNIHGEPRYKCTICEVPFASKNMFKHHMDNHADANGSHAIAGTSGISGANQNGQNALVALNERTKEADLPHAKITSLKRKMKMNEKKFSKALKLAEKNEKNIQSQLKRKCLVHFLSLFYMEPI